MIRHEYKRKAAKKRSPKSLKSYLHYLADPTEKDHGPKGMVLLPGRNHLCEDDSPEAFQRAVCACQKNYLKVRDGLPGKRSALYWEEIIYCLGKGVHHTPEERTHIENLIISRILPNSPCRPTWHTNPKTGMDDLHIPFSAKTMHGKMTLARTEVPLARRLKQLDEEIADFLNARPNPKRKHLIKSSRRVALEKAEKRHRRRGVPMPCPLPKQIAKLAGDEEITMENIYKWLDQLGITHEPTKNGKGLKLTYPKLRKAGSKFRNAKGRYPIRELVLLIKEARFDHDLVKYPEKYQDSPVDDPVAPSAPVITEPVTSAPVTTEPVTTEPVTTEPVTTAPVTTEPVTTAPVTTAPVTTAPVTTAPVTTAPVTTAPVTTAPVTTAPVTTAPVTTAPVTTAPVTTAPVTTAPVTTAPVTTAPVTTAPVTTAPVTTEPVTTEPVTTEPVTTEPVTTEPVSATIKEQKTEVRKRKTKAKDKNDEMEIN